VDMIVVNRGIGHITVIRTNNLLPLFLRAGIIHIGQAGTVTERSIADCCDTVRNGDGGQAITTIERIVTNGFDAVTDTDCGQEVTIKECIMANRLDTVADVD